MFENYFHHVSKTISTSCCPAGCPSCLNHVVQPVAQCCPDHVVSLVVRVVSVMPAGGSCCPAWVARVVAPVVPVVALVVVAVVVPVVALLVVEVVVCWLSSGRLLGWLSGGCPDGSLLHGG